MHLGVGLRNRDVVNERERFSANADEVVDVHGNAIDPNTLQPSLLTGQLQFRANPVSRQREPRITELDDASEPPRQRDRSAPLARCPHRRSQRFH